MADDPDRVADGDLAAEDLADGDTAHVVAPVDVGDEHVEGLVGAGEWRRDVVEDAVEERRHVLPLVGEVAHHPTMQYINGYENGSGINLSIENAKIFLRSKVPSYARNMGVKLLSKNMPSSMGCLKVGVRKLSMRRK